MKIKHSIFVLMIAIFAASCSSDDDGGQNIDAKDVAGEWTLQTYAKDYSKTSINDEGEENQKEGRETLAEGDVSFSLIKSGELVVTYKDVVFEDEYTEDGEEHTLTSKPKSTELGTWKLQEEGDQLLLKGFRDFKSETAFDIVSYSESRMELQADLSPSDSTDEENPNMKSYKLVLVRQ